MTTGKLISIGVLGLAISGCSSMTSRDIDTLPPTASLPTSSQSGVVELRYFNDIAVSSIESMIELSRYPDNPDETIELNRLEVLESKSNAYGSLVRGYIVPETTGPYRFFVSGDDEAQFVFSDSSSAVNAKVVASVPRYSSRNQFDKYSSQQSAFFNLTAGQRYYFEVRHREGYGGDHFSVAWEGPGFARSIIGSEYLASLGQESQLYPSDEAAVKAYGLGYRVGFFDGQKVLPFSPTYPPLDENQDGLYDNWTTYFGIGTVDKNVANLDQDGDLLSAFDEFWLGTSPSNSDTDGDGIPDGEEFAFGLDPLNPADASYDLDRDGFTNFEESRVGTDINDPADKPKQENSLIPGVMGQYFTGGNFNSFVMTRSETGLNFDWGGGSPSPEIPDNVFSARWNGYFMPNHEGGNRNYEFRIRRDDGARLYINGNLEFDTWRGTVSRVYTHTVSLPADEPTPFSLEYKEGYGGARISVEVIDLVTGQAQSEAFYKTNKLDSTSVVDTDADGIPDAWEIKHGLNPSSADANSTNNGSNISNLKAYQSGLSPWTLDVVSAPVNPEIIPPENGGNIPGVPPVVPSSTTTVTWTAPSTRVDGSSISLSEIAIYEVRYGKSEGELEMVVEVSSENTSYTFTDLAIGQWYFNVKAVDQKGLRSVSSETVSYTVR